MVYIVCARKMKNFQHCISHKNGFTAVVDILFVLGLLSSERYRDERVQTIRYELRC